MLRLILLQAFLFLTPFLVYAAFLWLSKRGAGNKDNWDGRAGWLVLGGLALAIVGMIVLSIFEGADPGAVYQPPVLKDGRIESPHFEAPE